VELLLREWNVVQHGLHTRQLEIGMVGDWSEDLRIPGGMILGFGLLRLTLLADTLGLRNSTLPSYTVHSPNLILCPACILRYPSRLNHSYVSDQRHHLQRDTSAAKERATWLDTSVHILSAVQDRLDGD
jgi:hypothetical protein